jgi:single-strand DNA-binding protein
MPNFNRVILIGHLGKDPEARATQTGKTVVNFTLATSKKNGGTKKTQWHNIVAWEKVADVIAKYCHKGDAILVEGEIMYDDYTDRDGVKRYKTEINANRMEFIKTKGVTEGGVTEEEKPNAPTNDGDTPF